MPALVLLNQKLQSQGIDMILISDEPIELLNKYKNTAAVPMKIYHINASFQSIGINTLPTSYLINSANELVYKATKVQEWTSDKLQNELIKAVK